MGGEIPRAKLDDMMAELRERLRHVSEHAAKAREAAHATEGRTPETSTPAVHIRPDGVARPGSLAGHAHHEPPSTHTRHGASHASLAPELWPEHLRHLSAGLDMVTRDSEKEFLSIGASLADFQQRAIKITGISEHVVRLITDKDIGRTIIELDRILFRMKEWLATCPPGSCSPARLMNARSVVDKTIDCLDSLQKKHGMSAHMLGGFLDKSNEITRSIGSVVESLQYNDITRQRLEHSRDTLRSVADRLAASGFGPLMGGAPGFREMAAEAGHASELQASELLSTKGELCRAVMMIKDSLSLIARDAAEMADEIHSVTRGDGGSGKSFLSAIGNWLGALTDSLTDLHDDPAGQLPDEFGNMVGELRSMVDTLHKTNGNVLYRLSIIEESGKTLSSDIADSVGGISLHHRVSAAAEEVAAGLDNIADEARRLAPEEMRRAASSVPAAHDGGRAAGAGHGHGQSGGLGDNVELF
ncbi:MAG: hypothetical protein HZC51_13910 [Nitrospirae bacterium]|nr:hypothetical protein [Nitrospirota bacterium]